MPRGNDAEAAAAELATQYGDFQSADDMIQAVTASFDERAQKALRMPVNEEATAALDIESLEAEGGKVIDAVVRGSDKQAVIVAIVENDDDGRMRKVALDYEPQAEADEPEPKAPAKPKAKAKAKS